MSVADRENLTADDTDGTDPPAGAEKAEIVPSGTRLSDPAPPKDLAPFSAPRGLVLYILRKMTVEPVFGQIKEVRGIRRFRLRGLRPVQCEWKLICATHNPLKLFRHAAHPQPA